MKQQPIMMDDGAQQMVKDLIKWWGLSPGRSVTKVLVRCLAIVHSEEKASRLTER